MMNNEANQTKDEKQSRATIIAAFIGGFFALAAAIIGAYAILAASQNNSSTSQEPVISNTGSTSAIAGTWAGKTDATDGSIQIDVVFVINPDCVLGQVCGNYDAPSIGCKGDLIFKGVSQDIFEFVETKYDGVPEYCVANGVDRFSLTPDGQLRVSYLYSDTQITRSSSGILIRK